MDEAGYGPNLGPLLVSVTRWKTPQSPHGCEFYQLLKEAIDPTAPCAGRQVHLADSKVVFSGKEGFRSLETSALVLLRCLGWEPRTFHELWTLLLGNASRFPASDEGALPPRGDRDLTLPLQADRGEIACLSERLCREMERTGLQLLEIRSDFVIEERFNRLTDAYGSKGLMLSRIAFGLLRSLWSPGEAVPTLIVGDKHGGRNRYDDLVAEILDGEMIFRLEEGRPLSRYRVGTTELCFQARGEAHLPVACASIISKYLRELAMDVVNQFWAQHCPGVKPTRGYPEDARRFRNAIEAVRAKLNIDERVFWRSR